ncbi:hypothetical protein PVAND_000621 [Polypedilum vanderplanki]|uniref:26S proteasome non-ATPase regulatory subunit 5 n=1 Tax=Polypedilum vanderplanki TaxID=319348 RepID=A0A9J6BLI7_POLVA|nr:hypothetical protein PVAND_000621 [Polypedilum vanderplanki]
MHEIINKISNLTLNTTEEEVYESLSELKSAIIQNGDISKSILGNYNLLKSFENYSNESEQNALMVCEIIEFCLSNLVLQDQNSFVTIEQILNINCFTRIAIRKLQKDCNEISKFVPKSTILLIINCLKSPQVQIGPPSIELLENFLSNEFLDDADIKRELNSCTEVNQSEIKCRIYDVAVALASKGFSYFEKTRFILEKIINELNTNDSDILLQMNLLEILQGLCAQDYGLNYLEEKGVLQNLARKIQTLNENPLISLLIPSLMKFFSTVASAFPQKIYNNYSPLIDLLFECLMNDEDSTLFYAALDTLGSITKYDDGKRSMDATFGEQICHVLSKIYQSITNYPSEIKVRAFQCLENVFYTDDNEPINNQIAYISRKWLQSIFATPNSFSTLLNYCNMPFDDILLSAFSFLKSIVKHEFGQKKVAETGGFFEFLLNRKPGTIFEVKQKRYEVIEILAKSNEFNANQIALFNKYVREGPNFVEPMSQIDFEPS